MHIMALQYDKMIYYYLLKPNKRCCSENYTLHLEICLQLCQKKCENTDMGPVRSDIFKCRDTRIVQPQRKEEQQNTSLIKAKRGEQT